MIRRDLTASSVRSVRRATSSSGIVPSRAFSSAHGRPRGSAVDLALRQGLLEARHARVCDVGATVEVQREHALQLQGAGQHHPCLIQPGHAVRQGRPVGPLLPRGEHVGRTAKPLHLLAEATGQFLDAVEAAGHWTSPRAERNLVFSGRFASPTAIPRCEGVSTKE
jgi:hypothetical protein